MNSNTQLLFPDDASFNPAPDAIEYKESKYDYYKEDGVWKRKLVVTIKFWCEICKTRTQCFHEIW